MSFLALAGGSGGGINPSSSQSAAIETGAFGGGTRNFGTVNIGSGTSTSSGSNSASLYIVGGIAALLVAAMLFRK